MGNCAGKPKKVQDEAPIQTPATQKQEPEQPVKLEKKKDEEVNVNDPFYRGPRPDPFKPVTKLNENEQKVEADVHQAPVAAPVLGPVAVVAPCGDCTMPCAPCVSEEPVVSIEPDQKPITPPPQVLDDKPRVSFVNDEPTQESTIERDETPLPPPREESPKSSVSSVSSISSHFSDKAPTPEPVVEEAPIEEEIIQEEMIAPIQRGMSTESDDKIGGVTLQDYEKSKKVAMDHFITEQVESKVEAVEEQRDNVQELIEEDIIQPISRTFSQETSNLPGKTLADFQSARDNQLDDVSDEITAALDELESAQKLLDEKHEQEVNAVRQETIDALGDDLVSAVTEKKEAVEADIVEDVSEPIEEMKTISVRVDEVMTKETAIEETTNILSRSLTFEDCPPLENEEELDEPSVESVIERELEDEDEDDEIDVEIQRVSQIRDDDVQIERPSSRADELGEPESVDDLVDFKRSSTERPSEPTPTAFDKNEQRFFPSSPQDDQDDDEELDSDEELERELAQIRADTAKNQERREQSVSPLSEPGDAEYDYVSKDMEPGNDVNNMIEANRDAAVKVDQNVPVELSPQMSPEPSVASQIEKEIEDIPKIADEIRQSMEDLNSIVVGAPKITKTDVQTFGGAIDSE